MSAETTEGVIQIIAKGKEIFRRGFQEFEELERKYLLTHPAEAVLTCEKSNALPWKKYASGSGEWIFADTKGAEELWAALKQRPQNGRIEQNGFIYRLSHGETRDFISRTKKGS